MAPDKIYVHEASAPELAEPVLKEYHIEYIRKDALLEVIATAREAAAIQKNFNNCPAEQEIRIDVYDYIMNKIESL